MYTDQLPVQQGGRWPAGAQPKHVLTLARTLGLHALSHQCELWLASTLKRGSEDGTGDGGAEAEAAGGQASTSAHEAAGGQASTSTHEAAAVGLEELLQLHAFAVEQHAWVLRDAAVLAAVQLQKDQELSPAVVDTLCELLAGSLAEQGGEGGGASVRSARWLQCLASCHG